MKQVKIVSFIIVDQYDSAGYVYDSERIISENITDWEDISDEDLEFLRRNWNKILKIPYFKRCSDRGFKLLVKGEIEVKPTIDQIKEMLKKEEENKKKAAEKRKRVAADRKKKKEDEVNKRKLEEYKKLKSELSNEGIL